MSNVQRNIGVFIGTIIATFLMMYLLFSATWIGTAGALAVASFMAALTLILGLISTGVMYQRSKAALKSKQKTSDQMATHQTRTIEIDGSLDLAFDMALSALNTLDDVTIPKTRSGLPTKQAIKIHKSDSKIGRIEAGVQAKTFGVRDRVDFSRIEIQLQRIDANTTRILIDSKPTSSLEMFDLGRHTHYVNHLALEIRQMAHAQAAISQLSDATIEIQSDDNSMDEQSTIKDIQ